MTDGPDLRYFEQMYEQSDDPWHVETGFYEKRKRELLLACLPRERFRAGFEPGCAAGALTERLSPRCDRLLAVDANASAVRLTTERVRDAGHVRVAQLVLPQDWPQAEKFDLIVLSEIGYFIDPPAWTALCERVGASWSDEGVVVACHWRHPFSLRRSNTDFLHEQLTATLGREPSTQVLDEDFRLDVWSSYQASPAAREGRR